MQQTSESSNAVPAPTKTKRSALACTRCRRYRSKCVSAPPYSEPCANCVKNGVGSQCYFPARGEVDVERRARRQQIKAENAAAASAGRGTTAGTGDPNPSHSTDPINPIQGRAQQDPQILQIAHRHPSSYGVLPGSVQIEALPPLSEVVEAVETFSRCYFQISFLPQTFLLENIEQNPECISRFLQLSILTVAAAWTPSLVKRYGSAKEAGDHFYDLAKTMIGAEMLKVSLEACQAFFLLSVFCWGRGNSDQSTMLVGVSVRMVGVLALHREGSYSLDPGATTEQITMSEVAGRTFWAIITHEHLASGLNRLASPRLDEIDTLLPGDESDFSFGVDTAERPSLHGTIPHLLDPSSASSCYRSLFATMCQSHALWAKVAQWACRRTDDRPWEPGSTFYQLLEELETWYGGLAARHRWSKQNLRGMVAEGKDIPFLSHIACYKLAAVVLKRKYLANMASFAEPDGTLDDSLLAPAGFWSALAQDMVQRTWDLISTIEDFFRLRGTKLGFAPLLIFALHIAGSIALLLHRWPTLCMEESGVALSYFNIALDTLARLGQTWPMAEAWHDALAHSLRSASPNGWGALKATAVAEKTADEAIGIIRHAKTATSATSPPFPNRTTLPRTESTSISPEAGRSDPHAAPGLSNATHPGQGWQFPSAVAVQSPASLSHLLSAPLVSNGLGVPPLPASAEDSFPADQNNFFPLTREGVPYDAFEDELVAFFRGEVPSYLDGFNLGA